MMQARGYAAQTAVAPEKTVQCIAYVYARTGYACPLYDDTGGSW